MTWRGVEQCHDRLEGERDGVPGGDRAKHHDLLGGDRASGQHDHQLKAVPLSLPVLNPAVGDKASDAGDWSAQLRPYIADVADHARPWWDKVLACVGEA